MRTHVGFVVSLGYGLLMVLLGAFAYTTMERTGRIYQETNVIHELTRKNEELLNELRSNLYYSGILVRDYLLDPSHISAPLYRRQLQELRASMSSCVDNLKQLVPTEDQAPYQQLHTELGTYIDSMAPLFEWAPRQKTALGGIFLRRQVLPHRNVILSMAAEISDLNAKSFHRQEQRIQRHQEDLNRFLMRMMAVCLAVGLLVAILSVYHISRLEGRAEEQHRLTLQAEQELRQLSHQLVRVQEEERKSISRDLHDDIGQMLTAIHMEMGSLEQARRDEPAEFGNRVKELKSLVEASLRRVRDMAMGLRPSMLDDLGLGPAVEWQARDFSRRSGLCVSTQLEGDLDHLPETHRTSIYRIIQETLTNCARHAAASNVRIAIHGEPTRILLLVQDDGAGFDPVEGSRHGLGLIGIEERVRELGGTVTVLSQKNRGTSIRADIPILREG